MKIQPDDFKMSPLAAYGLIAIALVFGVLGLEKFAQARTGLAQEVLEAKTEYALLSSIRDTDYWGERLEASLEAREQLQSEIWKGNTSGVIAAELQQSLRALGRTHKFENMQVRVDPDPVDMDGISVLKFEFVGRGTSAKRLADFFEGFASSPKIMIIDEGNLAQSARDRIPPRVTLAGFIPVVITPVGDSAAPAGGQ